MLSKIPYYCVLGGVFWTIVLSLGIASYSCAKSLKERSNTLIGFFSCMFLGSVLLVVFGTGLGWMIGQSPWLETRDVAAQLIEPYPLFTSTSHGRPTRMFQLQKGARSPDITKEDADAVMAHLKSVRPLSLFPASRKTPLLSTSFQIVESKSPYSGVVSVD